MRTVCARRCTARPERRSAALRCGAVSPREKKLRVSGIELDEARRRLFAALSEGARQAPGPQRGRLSRDAAHRPRAAPARDQLSFQTAAQMTPELAALCPECVYVPLESLRKIRRSPMRSAKTARRSSPRSPPLRSAKRRRASRALSCKGARERRHAGAHRKSRSRDDGGTGGFPASAATLISP